MLKVEGPCCICDGPCCPCDNEFKIFTSDKSTQIGNLKKEYAGFVKEMFTKADRFSISCKIFSKYKRNLNLSMSIIKFQWIYL